jgi:filamentous hemagglutinin family protein
MPKRLLWLGNQAIWTGALLVGLMLADRAVAQLEPDDSLGGEQSRISRDVEIRGGRADRIEGGSRRGGNLFHSFREFNLANGQRVYFANPAGVENIFSRVTGGNASNILGTLGVDGAANLFLLNPNGILFGRNAQLDIRGSFLGTTANAIRFGENFFSATNPEVPSPLLNIQPSALFFNQFPAGQITVEAATPINRDLNTVGLQVDAGENLALLGGAINLDGGGLNAPGGRLDLGAVGGIGTVGFSSGGFLFPADLPRGNVSLTNAAKMDVRTRETGGSITVNARTIVITGSSTLFAGILPRQNPQFSQSGDISLNATEQIQMGQTSLIENRVFRAAPGNSGDIVINTPILELLEGATVNTTTNGRGDAGDVRITATNRVTLQGTSGSGRQQVRSGALSLVSTFGNGNGGDVQVNTPILEVLDGAELRTETFGPGNTGRVLITASDRAIFRGESRDRLRESRARSLASRESLGDANNVEITTPILEVLDGASLSTTTANQGAIGDMLITASERVTVQGVGTPNEEARFRRSSITAEFFGGDSSSSGNIRITTPVLEVLDGAQLNVSTSRGNAGTIRILASDRVTFRGTGVVGSNIVSSNALSSVIEEGRGNGGNIEITTPVLEVLDGARLVVSTFGQGAAGNLRITADRAIFRGTSRGLNSAAFSTVDSRGQGNGGNLEINAAVLEVRDGAEIAVSTEGRGDAGSLLIRDGQNPARRVLLANRGSLSARSTSQGRAGNLTLEAATLVLRGDSAITATSRVSQGGDIRLRNSNLLIDNSAISASTRSGTSGGITLQVLETLEVNGGEITASTQTGQAGNVLVNASESVSVTNGGRLAVEATGRGQAGNLRITTDRLNLTDAAATVSSRRGQAGNLTVTADSVQLDQGQITAETAESGKNAGANIRLRELDRLTLRNGSQISANARGNANGGNVTINSDFIFARPLEDSDIRANAVVGNGGNIAITTDGLFGTQPADQPLVGISDITASSERGIQGIVEINTPNTNPTQGLEFSDAPPEAVPLAQECAPTTDLASRSSFVVVGRGGLPASPYEFLGSEDIWQDWRLGAVESQQSGNPASLGLAETGAADWSRSPDLDPPNLIEAQGWVRNPTGQIELVAMVATPDPKSAALPQSNCVAREATPIQAGATAE